MRKGICGILLLLAPLGMVFAENQIFNGDYALGGAGFQLWRLLSPQRNPKLEFQPLEMETEKGHLRLKLDNTRGEMFQIRAMEFLPPAGKEINFHTSVEYTGTPGTLYFSFIAVRDNGKWEVKRTSIPLLSGKKQEVNFAFTTLPDGIPYKLIIHPAGKERPAGTLQFGPMSLDDGKKTELIAVLSEKHKLLYPDETREVPVAIKIHNPGQNTLSGSLTLTLRDIGTGQTVWEKKLEKSLPHGVTHWEEILPLQQLGSFRLTPYWNGKAIRSLDGYFSCIRRYQGKPECNPSEDFCVAVNGGSCFEFRETSDGGVVAAEADPEEQFRLLQAMGCRLLRNWDGGRLASDWRAMEPEEGKFDFSHFDHVVDMARKYGITPMILFGRMYENWAVWQSPFRPDWLQKKLIRISPNPPGTNPKFIINVPPMEIWQRYVRAMVRHAGTRVKIYEIMNEPNLNMSPELYLKYMIPAAEVIRKEAPHATILGICSTGDMNADLGNFMASCVRLGAVKYLDGVSFHPYNARTLSSAIPADKQIQDLKKLIGEEKPLYNTELYFFNDNVDSANAMPSSVAHRFLTDLGEGVKQSSAIRNNSLWVQTHSPRYGAPYFSEWRPGPVFVMYNALARLFESAKPLARYKSGDGLVVYTYRRQGKAVGAIWQYRNAGKCSVDLRGMKVLDLYGNDIPSGILPLTENPYYLFPGKLSEAEFLDKLSKLRPQFEQSLEFPPEIRIAGKYAWCTVGNLTDKDVQGNFRLDGEKIHSSTLSYALIPAKQNKNIQMEIAENLGKDAPVFLAYSANNSTFRQQIKVNQNVFSTGKISGKSADGKLSFSGTVTRNGKKLVCNFRVVDSTDAGPAEKRARWETDGVELFLDASPNLFGYAPDRYTADTFRMFVNPRDTDSLLVNGNLVRREDCRFALKKDADAYSFTLEFPLPCGQFLGFGIIVHDSEKSEKAIRSAAWGAGAKSYKDRRTFGVVELPVPNRQIPLKRLASPSVRQNEDGSLSPEDHPRHHPEIKWEAELKKDSFYRVDYTAEIPLGISAHLRLEQQKKNVSIPIPCGETGKASHYTEYLYSGDGGKNQIVFVVISGNPGLVKLHDMSLTEIDLKGNLIPDGGFEENSIPVFWQLLPKNDSSLSARLVPSPQPSLDLRSLEWSSTGTAGQLSSRYLPLPEGKTAVLRFRAKSASPTVLDVVFNTWPRAVKHQGKHLFSRQKVGLDTQYRNYQLRYHFSESVKDVPDLAQRLMKIQLFTQGKTPNQIWFDDFDFRLE